MAFAQLTGRESLRDIEACLRAVGPKLYHAGMKARVSRNTLAKANELRDWKIYRDIALILIDQARMLYAHQPLAMNLKRAVYASGFNRHRPVSDTVSLGSASTTQKRRQGAYPTGPAEAIFPRLFALQAAKRTMCIFSIICCSRPGPSTSWTKAIPIFIACTIFINNNPSLSSGPKTIWPFHAKSSNPVDKERGLRSDQTIRLTGPKSSVYYPERLRLNPLCRYRTGQTVLLPDQQFQPVSLDHCPAVQVPLADRTVFQMDQAASSDQSFLRHHTQRRQNPGLDCHQLFTCWSPS